MLIRAVEHRDWPAIMAIQEACYHAFDPEPLSVMQSKWHLSPSTCFISEYHHRVVGYCLAHPWRGAPPALNQHLPTQISQPDTLYLHDMALAPKAQGLGAGQTMLKQLIIQAYQLALPTLSLVAVQGADSYWAQHGFRHTNTTKCLGSYCDNSSYMIFPLTETNPSRSQMQFQVYCPSISPFR